ncbi:MAG: MATE family efflux transporter [Clostridia bacterium]|jgi:putative MATE family efflux protein|nr:MATE family efflux transporter [Clostridia bacterium]MCI2000892.1 MATE family efflux transporter [Clostridia bacterium]MCI2015676.1 MATE family efflux transporter [Clostridia bacterium]
MLKEEAGYMTTGVIWKQLLIFFFPILFGTFFQQMYNTADALIVGRFVGKVALSAVGGSNGSITDIFVCFFNGLSSGAGVIVAQFYGSKKDNMTSKAVHTALTLSVVVGLSVSIIVMILARTILIIMDTPQEVLPDSLIYLKIYLCGMVPNMVYNMGSAILRSTGDSKRPLYFLIITCFVNIGLDILFVVIFNLGVAGVGTATVISQFLSAFMVIICLMRSKSCYKLVLRQLGFYVPALKTILYLGIPAGLQSCMYTFSNALLQFSINQLGTDTIAAYTAFNKIANIFWMMSGAYGIAITTFVGQNYGAGKFSRVKKSIQDCFIMITCSTIVVSAALYFLSPDIFCIFTKDSNVMAIGNTILKFLVPLFITYVAVEVFAGSLRGLGDSVMPLIITVCGVCLLRVGWLLTVVPSHLEIHWILASFPITWVVTSIAFTIYYFVYMKRNKKYFRTLSSEYGEVIKQN